jgi:hypothetical protein
MVPELYPVWGPEFLAPEKTTFGRWSFGICEALKAVLDLDRTGLDLTHESNPTRKSKLELQELLERQLPNTERKVVISKHIFGRVFAFNSPNKQ